jgi:anti-sigma regulatory factor (Ser/Thr protein kinase)
VSGSDRLEAGDRVELNFPARADLVVLARLVASAICARAGCDIEELEDMRLAVGELCLLTMPDGDAQHGELRLEVQVLRDGLEVSCTLAGATGAVGHDDGAISTELSTQILDALVDEHGIDRHDAFVRAWLRKRRMVHAE